MEVKKGSKVKIEYTGTLEDGTVFDSTENHGGEPLEFEAGAGHVIKGFDDAVMGMKKGEEKEFSIPPEEAYGQPRPELRQEVPKDKFPPEQPVKEGMIIGIHGPDGRQYPAKVAKVGDTGVTLDLNHPLAGKTLKFKIKVVDIE